MVPEQPPRRSKTDKEPVTIDLTAEQSDVVAEPVRSNDTDDVVSATEPAEDVSATAEEPAKPEPTEETASSPSATDEPRYDDPWSAAAQSEPQPATVAPEPESTPAPHHRTSPATSTLIAAGIFGGIVALLLAGSMQYAGYLPGATPAPASSNTAGLSSEIAALRQEIAALKNRPAAAAAPDAALANRVAALESAPRTSGGASEQALGALKADLDRLRATVQSATTADSGLAQRLDQAEAKLNDRGPEQQVARAVAAAALKAGIDRGGPFETELQTFVTVAGDDPAVADLQKFASAGVPARAELQRDFPRIADAMLEATVQSDPNEGIASRLLSSAMSVVKVRRVGDVQGETPDAIVARMENALRNGDLQASAREWDALPEPAKAVSRDFKQKLDARIQVENLVGGTLTRAVAGTQG
ncbi:COG4223 family protein [Neorhizobium sp. T25_13]|uniref:COG4223 family protein n=1 Tax=Neorhizobium sp. T25_13 TaxID=2093830 RepID=UPI000CF8BBB3|nr:mitofilin family membrane protein [Neorhizobium sp. T25_13]